MEVPACCVLTLEVTFQNKSMLIHFNYKLPRDTHPSEINKEFWTQWGAHCGDSEHSVWHVISLLCGNAPLSPLWKEKQE